MAPKPEVFLALGPVGGGATVAIGEESRFFELRSSNGAALWSIKRLNAT